MTSRRTEISCRMCGAPGRLYLGGRLCPRHAPGGVDGEVMRPFPDYTGRIPQVKVVESGTNTAEPRCGQHPGSCSPHPAKECAMNGHQCTQPDPDGEAA